MKPYGTTGTQYGTNAYQTAMPTSTPTSTQAGYTSTPLHAGHAGTDNPKNLPEKKFRAGPVAATIWANNTLDKDGKVVTYRTVSFERSYKDKNDKWQTTSSLRFNDLPRASLVLGKAFEYLALGSTAEETA